MSEYPNWFEYVRPNFEEFLTPLAGQDRLRFLQIGVFTGDASVWLASNILTGEATYLLDIDTWQGSKEEVHSKMDFADVYRVYKEKTEPYSHIITSSIGDSTIYLQSLHTNFHFAYIDGDHTTVGVILDAELAWQRLFSGGIMAFDDHTWGHESGDPRLAPQVGIDLFLHRHELDYELLAKNNQVWIRKKQ